jgi:hypothetical protein
MNCQDIALILDDGDAAHLDAATVRAVDAHLHACPACAADWKLHLRLAHKVLPLVPAGLAAACRTLVTGPATSRPHRARRLVVIAGMALAAAAALWIGLRNPPAPAPVAAVVPSPLVPVQEEVRDEEVQAAAASTSVHDGETSTPVGESIGSFSILLLAPESGTDDAAVRAAVRQFHEAILERLRAVPGAKVTEAQTSSGRQADYVLNYGTALGQFTDPEGLWRFQVNVHVPRSRRNKEQLAAYDAARAKGSIHGVIVEGYVQSFGYSSVISLGVPCQMGMCPARQATDVVNMLRLNAFSHDLAKQHELFARFMQPGTDFTTRQSLLRDFDTLAGTGRAMPVDAQFIRAILEVHADAPGRAQRLVLWNALRRYTDRALIDPIVTLTRQETDEQVRAALVTKLVNTFRSEAKALRALEEISAGDSSELVRQVARRATAGDEGWHQYVSATVQDVNLSPQQRWEPVEYLLGQESSMGGEPSLMQHSLDKLEGEAIAGLAELLPRIWADYHPEKDLARITSLRSIFGRLKDPALAGLLLQSLDGGSPFSRRTLVVMLERYIDDAPVAEALEKIQAADADPRIREAAAQALAKRKVASTDTPGPNP